MFVTTETIAEAMAKATTTTAVLHFVNSGLGMGGGQDPKVHDLFEPKILKNRYDALLLESPDIVKRSLSGAQTAIVCIDAKQNKIQQYKHPSYVLANPAPIKCRDKTEWSRNVDSVIGAIEEILRHEEKGQLTVFLGAHGCGIFENSAALVAEVYYSRLLEAEFHERFRGRLKIVFPVPLLKDKNFEEFSSLLKT